MLSDDASAFGYLKLPRSLVDTCHHYFVFVLSDFVQLLVLQLAGEVITVQAPGKCLAEADATGYLKATQNWHHMMHHETNLT